MIRSVEVFPDLSQVKCFHQMEHPHSRVDKPEEDTILVRLRQCPSEVPGTFWPPPKQRRKETNPSQTGGGGTTSQDQTNVLVIIIMIYMTIQR